jgi:hypothetical protein
MLKKTRLPIFYIYSSIRVRYNSLCINQIKYINISFWIRKKIILFNNERLEITTFAGRRSTNLVRDPLENFPSAPSKLLLSQFADHFVD